MSGTVSIVPTGTANLASVAAAFRRLEVTPRLVSSPSEIDDAERVVLPGVGAFAPAVAQLDELGFRDAITERIGGDRPTLAICLGMQLLGTGSEESPGHRGLGVVAEHATRLDGGLMVPQIGWNRVEPAPATRFLSTGWAYFANSYRLPRIPEGWTGATTEYGDRFASAIERGNVLACQFHPELSGTWGADLLRRWLQTGRETT